MSFQFDEGENVIEAEDYFSKKDLRKIKRGQREVELGLTYGPFSRENWDEAWNCKHNARCPHAGPGFRRGWRRWVLRFGRK